MKFMKSFIFSMISLCYFSWEYFYLHRINNGEEKKKFFLNSTVKIYFDNYLSNFLTRKKKDEYESNKV